MPRLSWTPFGRHGMASTVAAAPAVARPSASTDEDAADVPSAAGERWKPLERPMLSELPGIYLELSKARLAALVVLSTMGGYALAPGDVNVPTLLATTIGTSLCVASANSCGSLRPRRRRSHIPLSFSRSPACSRDLPTQHQSVDRGAL